MTSHDRTLDRPSSDRNGSPDSEEPLDHSHDAVLAREIAIEQRHVDRVYDRLGDAHRSAEQVAAQGKTLFERDRADFVREEDGTGLFERDVFAFQSARRLATLNAEHEGLVFGRLDLLAEEIRYIGRIGVRDEDYEPLVIDWRARAAEPFYRATSAEPMEVIRRRVLRSRSDRVIGIEDDLIDGENAPEDMVVIGEGALMAALSRARGPRMRDIVATIQAEQDEAIRAPYHGFTIIAGGPGTGKTVVALHRAAYLLYSNRRRFENGGVLVVGPSRVFMNYIERVLPSLGEDSVTLRALGSVASDVFGFRTERIDSAEAHAIKGSLRMLPLLRRLINEPVPTGDPSAGEATELRLRLTVKGEVFTIGAAQLERIRTEVLRHQKVNQARPSAEAALLTALWQKKPADLDLERAEFEEYVTESQAWQDFLPQWWPSLRATRVLRRLADPELVRRVAADQLSPEQIRILADSYAEHTDWSIDDSALLDELAYRLGPVTEETETEVPLFLADGTDVTEVVTTMERVQARVTEREEYDDDFRTYAHVLVDEAQDVTPMAWRMLRRRGAQASWTVVGDPAQSSWPDAAETDRAMTDLVGKAPVRRFRMSTNYRSPAEVFNLAAKVVVEAYPDADLPTAVRSTGVEPALLTTTPADLIDTIIEQVTELGEVVEGSIGVICPPSRIAAVTAALLPAAANGSGEAAGANGSGEAARTAGSPLPAEIAERLVVIGPLEAKGLEYDAVLVVSPDEIVAESPGGVRVLYVALTRPTQRLVTLDLTGGGRWRRSLGSRGTD
ncbi:HelD family protein [Granulicoccus phenolivorans]|uniref:HelD family protein n=1 Tax=Granulicoccus phenolivorans TaxID=266854 RepID=UPI0003FEB10F|nr:UvrD-helicase domain-containing protein [Granulicoccus phenolivorans]